VAGKGFVLRAALALALCAACGHEVRRTTYAAGHPWSEVRFKHGVPDGLWRTWWENGKLKSEGGYRAGEMHGRWRTWFEDGAPQTEQLFVSGRPEGLWKHWYMNGELVTEGAYERGQKVGWWREWFGDGTLKAEGEFKAGVPTGTATVYFEDGSPKLHTRFDEHGASEYMEIWNETGQIWSRAKGPIKNDRRNGTWTVYNLDGTVNAEYSGEYVDDALVKEDAK
jgi:antitoxin component YwqK of YwqJK toxin-antitoxin module